MHNRASEKKKRRDPEGASALAGRPATPSFGLSSAGRIDDAPPAAPAPRRGRRAAALGRAPRGAAARGGPAGPPPTAGPRTGGGWWRPRPPPGGWPPRPPASPRAYAEAAPPSLRSFCSSARPRSALGMEGSFLPFLPAASLFRSQQQAHSRRCRRRPPPRLVPRETTTQRERASSRGAGRAGTDPGGRRRATKIDVGLCHKKKRRRDRWRRGPAPRSGSPQPSYSPAPSLRRLRRCTSCPSRRWRRPGRRRWRGRWPACTSSPSA